MAKDLPRSCAATLVNRANCLAMTEVDLDARKLAFKLIGKYVEACRKYDTDVTNPYALREVTKHENRLRKYAFRVETGDSERDC